MADIHVPLGNIIPRCPQCGAALLIEHDGINANADDPVSCPTHGLIGTRAELFARIKENGGDEIKRQIRDKFEEALRSRGINFKRK